ncbi:MAG TPA: tetratricopeptide repeat protein [Gemmataceae bacterium]|nr:tetratricopeptide repeat protein [Gemmataceae bacterium]
MSRLILSSGIGWLLVAVSSLSAQTTDTDPPVRHVPVKPVTRRELDHLEAVKLYGRGVLLEHQNRLIEATRTFEEARRLDPSSAAIHRTLITLYFALDRLDDALASCRRVLELDPDDFETGYRYARQLRVLGKDKEATAVLTRTAACPRLKERLEVRAQVFYDLGQLQAEAGKLTKAEKSLREVLSILDNPAALMEQGPYNRDEIVSQAAETYERLGKLYLKSKKGAEAIEAFQAALKKDPLRSARLALNLAEVYLAEGQADKALEQVEQYLRTQPQGMEGYELRIKIQKQLGREADIVPSLFRSATADRNNQALQLLLAREYRKAGQSGPARAIYERFLEQSPTVEVYRGLFQLYKEEGTRGADLLLVKLDQAIGNASGDSGKGKKAELKEAQREAAQRWAIHARAMLLVLREDAALVKFLLPAATRRLSADAGLRFTTSIMLANLAGRTRHLAEAESLYRHCLRLGAGNEAEIYVGLLSVLSMAHKNREIIVLCNQGLKAAEKTSLLLFNRELAVAHMNLGHVRESLDAVDQAVQIASGPDSKLSCRLERALLLSQAERHQDAVAECQALLREYNQSGDVHKIRSVLSGIYSAAHVYDKAEEQLLLVLKDDPDDATANNDLGYLWADQNKKLEEAEKRIHRALELDHHQRNSLTHVGLDSDHDNAAYVDSLGWVLFRKGDWDGARRELERASSLPNGDDDPVVWDHLGDVFYRLKETEKAGSAWRTAIELYESGGRRRPDERYREIKDKLQNLGP